MNFDIIKCEDLEQAIHIPNTTEDHNEETWFVKFGEEIIGVGLFSKHSARCVLAIVGDAYDDKKIIGDINSHDKIIIEGLSIAFEGYLRSILGDVVIGEKKVDDE
ncbi:hypothetical protein D3C87_98560 [compost metagenome]